MADLSAGTLLTASIFNMKVRKRIARARRVTNSSSSTSTTEVGVLRLDDIPLLAGHNYKITYQVHMDTATSAANNTARELLRYTTDGSTPTTSSGILPGSGSEATFGNIANVESIHVETDYSPVADELLSLLLTIRHVAGTDAVIAQADGSVFHTQVYVDDMGDDPGEIGVDV